MPSFTTTPSSDPIHQVVTPLLTSRGGREDYASGTAFVIGRGWALTAYHVLDDFIRRYQGPPAESGNTDIKFEMLGYLMLDGGTRPLPIKFIRAWRAAPLDIAVLAFGVPAEWPDDHSWTVPAIDLLPPKVGAQIAAFGYPDSLIERVEERVSATLSVHPTTSTGEVQEVHHTFRDRSRLAFPCFRTNAKFAGGMSGGPVFDVQTGHICGIICSGTEFADHSEESISYASALWPVVATVIDVADDLPSGGPERPLVDLYDRGVLRAANASRVRVITEPDGRFSAQAAYDAAEWDAGSGERQWVQMAALG
jgi:Trypsin-like peptidase domain